MGEKKKILIVEDEAVYALLLRRQLTRDGFEVCDHVSTGVQALESCQKYLPDIILMDIRLAGSMDGIETAKALLEKKRVNIVFMTGYAIEEVREAAMQLHPLAFLEKPIDIHTITNLLE